MRDVWREFLGPAAMVQSKPDSRRAPDVAAVPYCGALAYHWINLAAIWFAAAFALSLSAIIAATIHL